MVTLPSDTVGGATERSDPLDLVLIVPLGSLNPPDHTIPNDHVAFSYQSGCPCDLSPKPVFAPADGTVRLASRGQDDGLEVGAPPAVAGSELRPWYYMGHVLLRADIQVGTTPTAGEQIGVTSPYALGVDLGVVGCPRTSAAPARRAGRATSPSPTGTPSRTCR